MELEGRRRKIISDLTRSRNVLNVLSVDRYHHVTVLLYTWFSYSARNPGLYFIAMNYTVHAVMYSYYFLMELRLWPKWLR